MWDKSQCACVCDLICLAIYTPTDDCTCGPIKGLECDPQYNGEFDEEYGCKDGVATIMEESGAKFLDLGVAALSATVLMLSLQ